MFLFALIQPSYFSLSPVSFQCFCLKHSEFLSLHIRISSFVLFFLIFVTRLSSIYDFPFPVAGGAGRFPRISSWSWVMFLLYLSYWRIFLSSPPLLPTLVLLFLSLLFLLLLISFASSAFYSVISLFPIRYNWRLLSTRWIPSDEGMKETQRAPGK